MKIYQLFISIFFSIFLSFFLATTASATLSCSGQNCTDDFNSGFGSWSSNSIPQQETAICGASCNSVKLANTTRPSPDGRLSKSFTVTPGATYQVSIKAGVYTDGAIPDGSVTLYALADDPNIEGNPNQVTWCHNTNCEALGSSIGSTFLEVNIIPQLSTLTITIEGTQGGCDIVGGSCHDPLVDDFTLTQTLAAPTPPSAPTNLSASCPAPGTTGSLSWTSGTGATSHNLRIDNKANLWSGNCSALNPGDLCFDSASPGNFTSQAGATYGWWVDACNSAGCTTGSGTNFTCLEEAPAALSADNCTANPSPGQTGQSITWNVSNVSGGTGTYTYSWTGTDSLSSTTSSTTATSNSVSKTYTTAGTKNATVTISSGTATPITKSCSVTITAAAQPDLIVDTLSPTTATAGDSVSFSGRVRNTGSASAGASSTRLRYDSNRDGTLDTTPANQPTGTLAADGSETETWPAVTLSTAGNYQFEICADNGSATPVTESSETNNCTTATLIVSPVGTPPAPTVTTSLSCIPSGYTGSGVIITYGSRTPPVTWADIDTQSSFAEPYYHKDVTSTTSTTAPNGFNNFCTAGTCTGSLSLNPATTYYVRVFDGIRNSAVNSFSIPACAAAFDFTLTNPNPSTVTVTQGGSAGTTSVTINKSGSPLEAVTLAIDPAGTQIPAGASVSFSSNPCPSTSSTCTSIISITPGTATPATYSNIRIKGTATGGITKTTNPFTLVINPPGGGGGAWIQTTGGDVHSNTRINTPGGP